MMPTTQQMLAAVQLALKEHVTPKVEDEWAQSALRSVDVILHHLQARVPVEGPMLHEDTLELAGLLTSAEARLSIGDAELEAFVSEALGLPKSYPAIEELQALNHRGREVINTLLERCHAQKGDKVADAVHADLRDWLLKHADRESSFFFPTYVGRPV